MTNHKKVYMVIVQLSIVNSTIKYRIVSLVPMVVPYRFVLNGIQP